MKRLAEKLLAGMLTLERTAAVILFAVMTLIMMVDVGLREVRGVGVHGASQIAVYCFVALSMIGIGMASATASHLRPKFVDRFFPERFEPLMKRIQESLMTAFCLAIASVATGVVAETYRLEEVSPALRIEIWWIQAVIPVVFYMAAVRHLIFTLYLDLKPVPEGNMEGETP